jgi:hypothetical protein
VGSGETRKRLEEISTRGKGNRGNFPKKWPRHHAPRLCFVLRRLSSRLSLPGLPRCYGLVAVPPFPFWPALVGIHFRFPFSFGPPILSTLAADRLDSCVRAFFFFFSSSIFSLITYQGFNAAATGAWSMRGCRGAVQAWQAWALSALGVAGRRASAVQACKGLATSLAASSSFSLFLGMSFFLFFLVLVLMPFPLLSQVHDGPLSLANATGGVDPFSSLRLLPSLVHRCSPPFASVPRRVCSPRVCLARWRRRGHLAPPSFILVRPLFALACLARLRRRGSPLPCRLWFGVLSFVSRVRFCLGFVLLSFLTRSC